MENTELDWVVGIGASAGGLEAIDSFFTHCPNNLNVTFVVVQHLSSNYKSMMIELIHRYTSMPVKMIEPGMKIEKNTIFLIRPGTSITLEDNHFCVKPKDNEKLALPIDIFFKSLAVNSKHLAIAIILSGTGSDGSRGAIEVSDAGGLVIAQDPKETKFDGMPTSLIATGVVDIILQTTDMPKNIAEYLDNPNRYETPKVTVAEYIETADVTFKTIIELLHEKLGIDFAQYKWGTFSRRLERRMQVKRVTSLKAYHEILRNDESEIKAMRNEQLIPVTRFFRDAEVFEKLEAKIIPELVAKADDQEGVRIWIAGVATGEEAYSLAMLFKEEIFKQKRMLKLKIFATDLNPKILDIASAASYPDTISKQIPQTLLTRYFTKTENKFTVNSDIRQCIVFAKHNLLIDPPSPKWIWCLAATH